MSKAILLFCFLFILFYQCIVAQTAQEMYDEAVLLEQQGDSSLALTTYENAHFKDPKNREFLTKLLLRFIPKSYLDSKVLNKAISASQRYLAKFQPQSESNYKEYLWVGGSFAVYAHFIPYEVVTHTLSQKNIKDSYLLNSNIDKMSQTAMNYLTITKKYIQYDSLSDRARMYQYLALLYSTGKYKKTSQAISLQKQAIEVAAKTDINLNHLYEELASYYADQGDFNSAIENLEISSSLGGSDRTADLINDYQSRLSLRWLKNAFPDWNPVLDNNGNQIILENNLYLLNIKRLPQKSTKTPRFWIMNAIFPLSDSISYRERLLEKMGRKTDYWDDYKRFFYTLNLFEFDFNSGTCSNLESIDYDINGQIIKKIPIKPNVSSDNIIPGSIMEVISEYCKSIWLK